MRIWIYNADKRGEGGCKKKVKGMEFFFLLEIEDGELAETRSHERGNVRAKKLSAATP